MQTRASERASERGPESAATKREHMLHGGLRTPARVTLTIATRAQIAQRGSCLLLSSSVLVRLVRVLILSSNRFRLVLTRLCAPVSSLKPPSWPVSFRWPLLGSMTRDLRYFLWDFENHLSLWGGKAHPHNLRYELRTWWRVSVSI